MHRYRAQGQQTEGLRPRRLLRQGGAVHERYGTFAWHHRVLSNKYQIWHALTKALAIIMTWPIECLAYCNVSSLELRVLNTYNLDTGQYVI